MRGSRLVPLLLLLLGALLSSAPAACALLDSQQQQQRLTEPVPPAPPHTQHARLARWLIHWASWGSLATTDTHGAASVGVVSFADDARGRLFFYLTAMDETGRHITERPECALSVSKAQLQPGGCGATDPMDPTCARITVLGRMLPVEAADEAAAAAAVFARHPAAASWPADHGFRLYELHLREVHVLDWYGGGHVVTPDEYFAAGGGDSGAVQTGTQRQQQQHALTSGWTLRRGGQHVA